MPPRTCLVTYVDHRQIRHGAEVQAESLYEAAVLAIKLFREDPWLDSRQAAERGESVGTIAVWVSTFGLIAHESEQAALVTIRRLRQEGRSFQQVADALNAAGLQTRAGTCWRFEYVRNLLKTVA